MSHYVTMIDSFMSGWGPADGKNNIYMVECDTYDQAMQIIEAAKDRNEMKKVRYRGENKPYYSPKSTVVSHVQFHDLGPIWTGEAVI